MERKPTGRQNPVARRFIDEEVKADDTESDDDYVPPTPPLGSVHRADDSVEQVFVPDTDDEAEDDEPGREEEVDPAIAAEPVAEAGKKLRYRAKCWALTYPNMDADSDSAGMLSRLRTKFAGKYAYIRVAREIHKTSGKPHYHVFLAFKRQPNYTDAKWADLDYNGPRHPNIKVAYDPKGWIEDYMSKEDKNHVADGEDKWTGAVKNKFTNFLNHEGTDEEAISMLMANGGSREVALSADRLLASRRIVKKIRQVKARYAKPDGYTHDVITPDVIQHWIDTEMKKPERAKCLIVVGKTRLGKTALFRQLFPDAIFWRNGVNLDDFDESASAIIMDDIYWDYIPNKKTYLTQMGAATVTSKYRQMTNINVKMPAIVLLNEMPVFKDEPEYWIDNTYIVQLIDHPLYGELRQGISTANIGYVVDYAAWKKEQDEKRSHHVTNDNY